MTPSHSDRHIGPVFGEALAAYERAGYRVERQVAGQRDMTLCRGRQRARAWTPLGWVVAWLDARGVDCVRLWVDETGQAQSQRIRRPR